MNKLVEKPGPKTLHISSGRQMDVFDAAMEYKNEGSDLVVIAGKDYGSGGSLRPSVCQSISLSP